jgi:hypothetical protein
MRLRRLLDALWYIIAVGAALISAVIVVATVFGWAPTVEMPLHFTPDPAVHEISGPIAGMRNARVEDAIGTLRFEAHPAIVLTVVGIALVGVATTLAVLHQLRRIVATMSAGTPFVEANARRLRFVGLTVIVYELVTVCMKLALSLWAARNIAVRGLTVRWVFNPRIEVLLFGALILLIAEVFRVGTRLQHDHDLTI